MTTNNTNSRAFGLASLAVADIASSRKSSQTGQSRMIAALAYSHVEGWWQEAASPGHALTVDLTTGWRDVSTDYTPRPEVTERLNYILSDLFSLMNWNGPDAKWEPADGVEPAHIIAAKMALRRTLPSVAHLIANAGEGCPIIHSEHTDKAMMDTGAACALVTSGKHAGRLKVRADLLSREEPKENADRSPVLLDGASGRTVEALGRVARIRLGIVHKERRPQDWGFGSLQGSLSTVRGIFEPALSQPELFEKLAPDIRSSVRDTCRVLLRVLYPGNGGVDLSRLEADLSEVAERRAA